MRRVVLSASVLLAASMPVQAQNLDALRDGLGQLPAAVLSQNSPDLAYFADMQVIAELAQGEPMAIYRLFARPVNQITPHIFDPASDWWAKAGTQPEALRYFTGYGNPPDTVSFWGLADEVAVADMMAALERRDFVSTGAPGVIGNGEPMLMNPDKHDPSDPWRTMVGAAQFAGAKGTSVVQASKPQTVMLAAANQPSLADNPIVQTALAGLEQSVGDAWMVQAMLISPIFGLNSFDPAELLSSQSSMEEIKQKLEEQMAKLSEGIPPYLGGIIADVELETAGLAIALAYPDCTTAQAAADAIAARWEIMAPEAAQGQMTPHTAKGEGGLCAATFSVFTTSDGPQQNPAYYFVMEDFMRSRAGVLHIGES